MRCSPFLSFAWAFWRQIKKPTRLLPPKGFHRVGLLFNEPSSIRWAALYLVFRLLFNFSHSHRPIVQRLGAKASAESHFRLAVIGPEISFHGRVCPGKFP